MYDGIGATRGVVVPRAGCMFADPVVDSIALLPRRDREGQRGTVVTRRTMQAEHESKAGTPLSHSRPAPALLRGAFSATPLLAIHRSSKHRARVVQRCLRDREVCLRGCSWCSGVVPREM